MEKLVEQKIIKWKNGYMEKSVKEKNRLKGKIN